MSDFPPDFGPRLRAAMALHNLKQHELATSLGVSREMVSQMCGGKRLPAKPATLLLRHRFGLIGANYILGKTNVLPSLFSQACVLPCSECDGNHHAVLGSDTCKHCAAVIPEEFRV